MRPTPSPKGPLHSIESQILIHSNHGDKNRDKIEMNLASQNDKELQRTKTKWSKNRLPGGGVYFLFRTSAAAGCGLRMAASVFKRSGTLRSSSAVGVKRALTFAQASCFEAAGL